MNLRCDLHAKKLLRSKNCQNFHYIQQQMTIKIKSLEYTILPMIEMRALFSFPTENFEMYSKWYATIMPAKNPLIVCEIENKVCEQNVEENL